MDRQNFLFFKVWMQGSMNRQINPYYNILRCMEFMDGRIGPYFKILESSDGCSAFGKFGPDSVTENLMQRILTVFPPSEFFYQSPYFAALSSKTDI